MVEIHINSYRKIAEVQILHHYFLDKNNKTYEGNYDLNPAEKAHRLRIYDVQDWLSIIPTPETKIALLNFGIIYKLTHIGIALFTEVDAQEKPLKEISDFLAQFDLQFKAGISSHTALAKFGKSQYHLFSNQMAWIKGTTYPTLSLKAATYSDTQLYPPGEIVIDGVNQFMSLQKRNNKNKLLSNRTFWKPIDAQVSYATSSNLVNANSRDRPNIAMKVELRGQKGMGDYSLVSHTNVIKNRVFQIHLNKL